MKITFVADEKKLAYTLASAFDHGITYWAERIEMVTEHQGAKSTAEAKAKETGLAPICFAGLVPGAAVVVSVWEDNPEPDPEYRSDEVLSKYRLELWNIRSTLRSLCSGEYEEHAEILGRVLRGTADANDADIFVQMCLFGKVVYG